MRKPAYFLAAAALVALQVPAFAQGGDLATIEAQIGEAIDKRDWTGAIALGRQALAIEEKTKGANNVEVAGTLTLIAGWQLEIDQNAGAEANLRRALTIFEATVGADDENAVKAATNLAKALEGQNKLAEAGKIYEATLANIRKRHGDKHKLTALAINNQAFNVARQGRYKDAQQLYDKALSAGRAAMDEEDADLSLIIANAATNMTSRGRYLQAAPLHNEALKYRSALLGDAHPDIASSLNGVAFNLSAQGRHTDAGPLYERALAIRERITGEDRKLATSVNNMAHNLNARDKPVDAEPLYARARDTWQRLFGVDHPLTAIGISNIGANLESQKRYAEALPYFEQALAIRLKTLPRNHPDIAASYFKIGRNLRLQGRIAGADKFYDQAIAIRRQSLGGRHPDLALALADHAELALLQGPASAANALSRAREAVAIATKRREQALTGKGPGMAGAEQQALIRAQGVGSVRADPLNDTYATLLRALWQSGKTDDATKSEAFAAAQALETSVAALTMAQTAARTATGAGPLTLLVRSQQDLSAQAYELDQQLLAALAAGQATDAERLRTEIAATAAKLSAADADLRRQYPDYAQMVQPQTLTAAVARERLGANEGLLLIVPVGEDVFAFGVSNESAQWNRVKGGTADMTRLAANLRCQIDHATCTPEMSASVMNAGATSGSKFVETGYAAYDRAAAHRLYQELVVPVETAFKGKARLFVTATGGLSGIPPNILVTERPAVGQDGADPKVLAATPWLADRYALVALPSVSVLRAIKAKAAATQQLAFIGYGAPVLLGEKGAVRAALKPFKAVDENGATLADPDTLRTLSPLPGTARELAAMATTLNAAGGNVVTGQRATERAVRSDGNLGRARIIAFATHGVLPLEVSGIEEPGLVFTPPSEASGSDDGLLAASEVAKLSLTADWVLLSACNTASGDGTPGADSLSSLARSFLYAGASALLASHWRVSDDATARLTVETLRGRSGGGLSRAEALRQAMKAIRTGVHADGSPVEKWDDGWAHPSAWGGFMVISNSDD